MPENKAADYMTDFSDVTVQNLKEKDPAVLGRLFPEYMNIIFNNRVVNLQKVYPCGGCSSTVVVGRRGITRKEEFLFGSTSIKILHEAKDCSVWVIR